MPTQKIDPKVIFASDAPAVDRPPVFSDKTKGWDISRVNDGRPEIKQMNKLQQDTDLKILWLNENSVTPYDETIDYPDGAVTVKDGVFKILNGSAWDVFIDTSTLASKDEVKRGIANKYDPALTYQTGNIVLLDDGTEVVSIIPNNTNDPNLDMTGWVKTNLTTAIYDEFNNSQQDINAQIGTPLLVGADPTGIQDVTAALNLLANPSGLSVMFLTKGDFKTGTVSIPANTVCYMNGAKFIRKQYTNTPVIDVGENSLIVGAVVDGNKDALGSSGGIRDYGIRLATGAKALFCTSSNNFKHGITCRSTDLSVSRGQQVLFCETNNNGFNAGSAGTADGINAANSDNFLFFGCYSSGSSRTGYVGETYNTVTADTDISLSKEGRCISCTESNSGYNGFNFEAVTSPTFNDCHGGSINFRESPYALVVACRTTAVSGLNADYPTVSNVKIKNDVTNNERFYLNGKSPKASDIDVEIGEDVSLVNTATVVITASDGLGYARGISVNRAYVGMNLFVRDADGLHVGSATSNKYRYSRPEKTVNFNFDDFSVKHGLLNLRLSQIPSTGYFKTGDVVINSFSGGSIYGWQCVTSGLDSASIWQQIGIRGLTKAAPVANAAGGNPTSVEYNDLLSKLRSCGILTT